MDGCEVEEDGGTERKKPREVGDGWPRRASRESGPSSYRSAIVNLHSNTNSISISGEATYFLRFSEVVQPISSKNWCAYARGMSPHL
jgi:hypothetical protein